MAKLIPKKQRGGMVLVNTPDYKFNKEELDSIGVQQDWLKWWYQNRKVFPDANKPGVPVETILRKPPGWAKRNLQNKFGPGNVGLFEHANPNTIYIDRLGYPATTPVHELNHYVQFENMINPNWNKHVTKAVKDVNLEGNKWFQNPEYKEYLTDPSEVQSRLMEYRMLNGLDPDKPVTKIDRVNQKIPEGNEYFFKGIDDKRLIDLLNKVASNKPKEVVSMAKQGIKLIAKNNGKSNSKW